MLNSAYGLQCDFSKHLTSYAGHSVVYIYVTYSPPKGLKVFKISTHLEVHLLVGEGEVELQILEEVVVEEGVGEVDHQVQEEGEEVGQ